MIRPRWYRDFLQDFSQLLKSGIPVLEALDGVAAEQRGPRAAMARRLAERVRGGSTLGEAMAGAPGIPEEHAALADAGEQSGALDRVLSKLVERLDREREMISQLVSKIAYPVTLVVLSVVLLPLYLLVSEGVRVYATIQVLFFGGVAAIVGLCWFGSRRLARNGPLRESLERIVLKVPWLGSLIAEGSVGRAFGVLGLLAGAGLPLGRSFDLVAKTTRWVFLSRAFRSLEKRLLAGKTLAEAFSADSFFSTRSSWTARLAVAEKAGALEKVCIELGEQLESKARSRIAVALRVLPSLLIPVVGAFILWRALSVFTSVPAGF